MTQDTLDNLARQLRVFAADRDWDRFHSPKNLAMALTGESGELAAELQWLSDSESQALDPERLDRVKQEAADVLLYLIRFADKLQFDLIQAAQEKIKHNARKYPAEKVRGSSRKYNEY